MSVPNQKHFTVNKQPCNEDHLYTKNNLKAKQYAARNLKPATFILWNYFADNQDGYPFYFAPADVIQTYGLSRSSCQRGIYELEEKGFIESKGSNTYMFFETPHGIEDDLLACYEDAEKNFNDDVF